MLGKRKQDRQRSSFPAIGDVYHKSTDKHLDDTAFSLNNFFLARSVVSSAEKKVNRALLQWNPDFFDRNGAYVQ